MKKSILAAIIFSPFILLFISFANAAEYGILNYNFLDETPGEYFNNQDWKIFLHAEKKALNQYPDGKTLRWKNENTGSWGTMTPSRTTHQTGTRCRALTFDDNSHNRTGKSTFTFCKINGVWKAI